MSKAKKNKSSTPFIANRKVFHDYIIEKEFEAGLVLQGWEAKAIRQGRVNLRDSHIIIKKAELWLIGCHISPPETTAQFTKPDPLRTRKLLLQKKEINKLIGLVKIQGYTLVAINFHYKHGKVKCQMALAKGKKLHDKRASEKEKSWQREKQSILKKAVRS